VKCETYEKGAIRSWKFGFEVPKTSNVGPQTLVRPAGFARLSCRDILLLSKTCRTLRFCYAEMFFPQPISGPRCPESQRPWSISRQRMDRLGESPDQRMGVAPGSCGSWRPSALSG
jgi:hypothetical protein